jgi:hypothetical protein
MPMCNNGTDYRSFDTPMQTFGEREGQVNIRGSKDG